MSEIKLFNLPYTPHLLAHYKKFHQLPGFVLLQTLDKSKGRYDILSAYPYDELRIDTADACSAVLLAELQKKLRPTQASLDLPFQGGAMGYFSYDWANHLAGISYRPHPQWQKMPLVCMGLYDWAIIVDHALKKVTLFSGNTQTNTVSIAEEMANLWQSNGVVFPSRLLINKAIKPLMTKADYEAAFDAIAADLRRGRCYQVNFTQCFSVSYEGEPWDIYEKISQHNPVPYAAFIQNPESSILSFSPERFLLGEERQLLTSPIKGTISRGATKETDKAQSNALLNSTKNRAENIMIVDLLRNDLGKIAKTGSVKVSSLCGLESFPSVHHLVSHIRAESKDDCSPLEAFQSCFPGGSITGAPKREAMRVIAEQEPWGRGVYCGSIGYFSRHGRFDTNIAIRTITTGPEIFYVSAGGGIVLDSNAEEEYQECFTKIAAIMNALLT